MSDNRAIAAAVEAQKKGTVEPLAKHLAELGLPDEFIAVIRACKLNGDRLNLARCLKRYWHLRGESVLAFDAKAMAFFGVPDNLADNVVNGRRPDVTALAHSIDNSP